VAGLFIGQKMKDSFKKLKVECDQFLELSGGYPAVRALKPDGRYVKRVKVRHKKNTTGFMRVMGDALKDEYEGIDVRSVITNGPYSTVEGAVSYYIFPKNGFSFLFNPRVTDHEEYKESYERLIKLDVSQNDAMAIVEDAIEYAYTSGERTLKQALQSNKEIIFYGMPYYYAISAEKHPFYEELFYLLQK